MTDKKRRRLYPAYASGAALATASSIAGTISVIWVVLFAIVGHYLNFTLNTLLIILGAIISLASGIASYRWAFNYFMMQKKDIYSDHREHTGTERHCRNIPKRSNQAL